MRRVADGTWKGQPIRRARKAHRCDYWHGSQNGGRCKNTIQPGEDYVQGELNDDAGGFGHDRYCLDCAGPEARAAAQND